MPPPPPAAAAAAAAGRLLARVALGCCCLAALLCGGGVDGKMNVYMPGVVEALVGQTAVMKCDFSFPGSSSFLYINWFFLDKDERTKIASLIGDTVRPAESGIKDRVSIVDNFTLSISKVTPQDAKTYLCQVGAGSGGFGENRTELRVSKAPEPPTVQVQEGIAVSSPEIPKIASCVSNNGYPAQGITWYKNEQPLSNFNDEVHISFKTTMESSGLYTVESTLFARVKREDRNTLFRCQVNYVLMGVNKTTSSQTFNITVHYPSKNITFVVDGPGLKVKEGDPVTLHCETDGNPPPVYILSRLKEGDVAEDLLQNAPGKVFLESAKQEDSGVYRCQALDLDTTDQLEAEVNLLVNYLSLPKITPESLKPVREGTTVRLTCDATSSKPMVFQWEKKGNLLTVGKELQLSNISHETSGNYTCVVTAKDMPGLSRARDVPVTVHFKPRMLSQKHLVLVQEGELVNLTCEVFAIPKAAIQWSATNDSIPVRRWTHHVSSVLTVQVTPKLLESGINCVARNGIGFTTHHFKLDLRPATTAPPIASGNETTGFRYNQTENGTSQLWYNQTQNGTSRHWYNQTENKTAGVGYNQTENGTARPWNNQTENEIARPGLNQTGNGTAGFGYNQTGNGTAGFGYNQTGNGSAGFGSNQTGNGTAGFGYNQTGNGTAGFGSNQTGNGTAGFGYNQTGNGTAGFGYNQTQNGTSRHWYNQTENKTAGVGYNQTENEIARPGLNQTGNGTAGFGYNQTGNGTAEPCYNQTENGTAGFGCNQTSSQIPDWAQGTNKSGGSIPDKGPIVQESKGVIIVAVMICILLVAVLGAVLYFLHKKGKLPCGRSGKQEITRSEVLKDELVGEVKSDKLPEEAGLLQGAKVEKRSTGDQGEKYIDLRN